MAILAGNILLDVARVLFEADISFPSGLFSQSEILGYIDQVQNDFLSKAPVVYNSAAVTLDPSKQFYQQPTNCLWLERFSIGDKSLRNVAQTSLDLYRPNWISEAPTATPNAWFQDQAGNEMFAIVPQPVPFSTAIVSASNESPINIGTVDPHGLVTGKRAVIQDVLDNTAANGTWTVTVTSPNTFTLNGSAGNGVHYTSPNGVMSIPCEAWFSEKVIAPSDAGTSLLVPFVFTPYIKYGVIALALSKDSEQRNPEIARFCKMRYDFGVLLAQRFLEWSKMDIRLLSRTTMERSFPVPAVVEKA